MPMTVSCSSYAPQRADSLVALQAEARLDPDLWAAVAADIGDVARDLELHRTSRRRARSRGPVASLAPQEGDRRMTEVQRMASSMRPAPEGVSELEFANLLEAGTPARLPDPGGSRRGAQDRRAFARGDRGRRRSGARGGDPVPRRGAGRDRAPPRGAHRSRRRRAPPEGVRGSRGARRAGSRRTCPDRGVDQDGSASASASSRTRRRVVCRGAADHRARASSYTSTGPRRRMQATRSTPT